MNQLRYWVSTFFNIPKSQANGLIMLLPLCLLIIAFPYIYDYYNYKPSEVASDQNKLDSLLIVLEQNAVYESKEVTSAGEPKPAFTDRGSKKGKDNKPHQRAFKNSYKPKSFKVKLKPFDINTADTIELKKIRGIGSVLSKRIIKYRDLLGGFVNKDQYREVYGLKDSVVLALDSLAIINDKYTPETININEADEWALSKHPYLKKKQAKAIITYRQQHGKFSTEQDLFNLHLLDSVTVIRISPYLNY